MQISRLKTSLCAIAALGLSTPMALADAITVTDIAGRSVTLADTPQRIILGEGRMMYAIAPLATDDPFEHVVGWKDDLILYDPDAFRRFEAAFPEDTARMVNFGNPYSGDFSIEAVLENEADLLILDLGNLFKAQETGLIEKLDEAGVAVVFIDFRRDPTANTIPSMLLLGRLLEEESRAAEFIDFYVSEMRKVTNIVQTLIALICITPFAATAEEFRIMMLNAATDDAQHTNLFAPDILYVQSGDTITFVPTDTGHNTASKRGMIPVGAEPWNSGVDQEFSITLTVPGVYGYVCLPHYEMGMVGLIIVGEELPNLDEASKVRHPGAARTAFRGLLEDLKTGS